MLADLVAHSYIMEWSIKIPALILASQGMEACCLSAFLQILIMAFSSPTKKLKFCEPHLPLSPETFNKRYRYIQVYTDLNLKLNCFFEKENLFSLVSVLPFKKRTLLCKVLGRVLPLKLEIVLS